MESLGSSPAGLKTSQWSPGNFYSLGKKVHSQIELGVVAWGCSVKLVAKSLVYQKKKTVFSLPFSRLPQFSLIQFNFIYIVPIHNNR